MKKLFYITLLFFFSFLGNALSNTLATEDYIGVQEGDTYTWKIVSDEDVYEDFIKDFSGPQPQASDDSYEENDYFDEAYTLTEGNYIGLVINDTDNDWFKVYVQKDSFLEVEISFEHDFGDIDMELLDSSENSIDFSASTSDSEEVSTCASYSGYYYILIFLCDDNESNSYDLYINIGEQCPEYVSTEIWDWEAIKIEIEDIESEVRSGSIDYVPVDIKFEVNEDYPSDDWIEMNYKTFYILNPDDSDFTVVFSSSIFLSMNDIFYSFALIAPKGVNWDEFLDDLEDELKDSNMIKDFSWEKVWYDYHLKLTFNNSTDDIEVIFRYNDNGVLEYGEVLYGGVQAIKVEIEGLNIYTMIAIITAIIAIPSIIGIVFLVKKVKG
ncbi:MAG: hypothetical protein ACP6IY_06165 [Promethearchaeia archaeon]